jgi:hypothetical protein
MADLDFFIDHTDFDRFGVDDQTYYPQEYSCEWCKSTVPCYCDGCDDDEDEDDDLDTMMEKYYDGTLLEGENMPPHAISLLEDMGEVNREDPEPLYFDASIRSGGSAQKIVKMDMEDRRARRSSSSTRSGNRRKHIKLKAYRREKKVKEKYKEYYLRSSVD